MTLGPLAPALLRTLPAEKAHALTIAALKLTPLPGTTSPSKWGTGIQLRKSGLHLPNPVGLAAGFDKNAEVFRQMAGFGLGFIECGTVTPRAQPGNPKPRVFRLPADEAVINRLGFNNHGLESFCRRLESTPRPTACPIGANVGANKDSEDFVADYEVGIKAVHDLADYITINISSPNTPGLRDLQGEAALAALLTRCQEAWTRAGGRTPVFLKIAPDLEPAGIDALIAGVLSDGSWLSGLIVSNTTLARPDTLKSRFRTEAGGLSGRPLMALSTDLLRIIAETLGNEFDLIGCGGISTGADVYAKLRAGAQAVQLYTALTYHGAGLVARLNRELATLLKADGLSSVEAAIGADLPSLP